MYRLKNAVRRTGQIANDLTLTARLCLQVGHRVLAIKLPVRPRSADNASDQLRQFIEQIVW